MVELGGITRHKIKDEKMETINYNGTTICILDDSDILTDCPIGSFAVIEYSGNYIAVRVGENDAPASLR
ncbi:hypothetical protein [Pectobacterium sp. B2J-2]|uniref:hypothetical protein n=1 Tax=Pectobacterium sp. B2J-2 TaxID=3385372 RepID=UPI0038FCF4FB